MKGGPSSLCQFPRRTARGPRLGFRSSAQCKRLYQADTSIEIPTNGWLSLFAPWREERPGPESVQFVEPFVDICDHGFEKNTLFHTADPHTVALEPKLFRQAYGLTAPVTE